MHRTLPHLVSIFVLSGLILGGTRQAYADALVVSDCGDSGLPTQLRHQLLEVKASGQDGTITFSCTTPVVLADGALPEISFDVTIDGGDVITLSGNNASRLFKVTSGANLTLENITITKGYADGDGGAIYSEGTLTIENSRFLDNQTTLNGNGGAIISFGTLNIANSEFAHNKAANGGALYPTGAAAVATIAGSNFHDNETMSLSYGWGGAIYMSAGAAVTIDTSTLNSNHALSGGGVYLYQTSGLTYLHLDNSTLNGNLADETGGAIAIGDQAGATLNNVTISGNQSGYNGGGVANAGSLAFNNSTLSDNQATQWGGGLYNSNGTAALFNVTLSTNSATPAGKGGGIFNAGVVTLANDTLSGNEAPAGGAVFNQATANLNNTLIAKGAQGENCAGAMTGEFNLSDDVSCGFGVGRDNVDLLLGSLANNGGPTLTHMPQAGSPAIDGGSGRRCTIVDQRGALREGAGTACDVGSVEYGAIVPGIYLPLVSR